MFRTSIFSKAKLLVAATTLGLALSTGMADAGPLGFSFSVGSSFVEAGLSCPVGTHSGYEGKYCWPNHASGCPAGTHLGYEGKYCWPNRY